MFCFKIISTILLFFILSDTHKINAQQPKLCGGYRIDMEALQKARAFLNRTEQTQLVGQVVRVFFYICRNNNGSNPAATEAQIEAEFNQLASDFAPNGICIIKMGLAYINSTQINSLDPENPSQEAMLQQYLVPNCITIFYHADLAGGGGYAYDIPNIYCSIDKENINLWRSISHEVGHCLGLLHTFDTSFGSENINGTNCADDADLVCDTPADPPVGNSCFSSSGCLYTGTCTDPNGATNYSPPYNNIMSYWGAGDCNINQFTVGQYSRMNSYLSTDPELQTTTSPYFVVFGPATITSGYLMQSAIFDFTTTANVFLGGSIKSCLQGQKVILNPGFIASPSNGSVIIRPNACNY